MSYTYIIIDTESQDDAQEWLVKIGKSKNPRGRLAGFRTANPGRLELLAWLPGSEWEGLLHATFSEFRLNGEWFRIDLARVLVMVTLADEHLDGGYDFELAQALEARDCLYATNPCMAANALHGKGWDAGVAEERHMVQWRAEQASVVA